MSTMKSVRTAGVHQVETVDVELPEPGPKDALVKIRACGICGTGSSSTRRPLRPASSAAAASSAA